MLSLNADLMRKNFDRAKRRDDDLCEKSFDRVRNENVATLIECYVSSTSLRDVRKSNNSEIRNFLDLILKSRENRQTLFQYSFESRNFIVSRMFDEIVVSRREWMSSNTSNWSRIDSSSWTHKLFMIYKLSFMKRFTRSSISSTSRTSLLEIFHLSLSCFLSLSQWILRDMSSTRLLSEMRSCLIRKWNIIRWAALRFRMCEANRECIDS
jgi:hypothetical protein